MESRTKFISLVALIILLTLSACSKSILTPPPSLATPSSVTPAPAGTPSPAAIATTVTTPPPITQTIPPSTSILTSEATPVPAPMATPALNPTMTATPTPLPDFRPSWKETGTPPNGFVQPNVRWIEIDAPDGYKLIAAVFRPSSPGPFPVVVVLHGSGGFSGPTTRRYGDHFAQNGFLVVAGSWFSSHSPRGGPAAGLIDWPKGPPFAGANLDSMKYADAIIKTARMLPEANGEHIGLFGTSRGAMISLLLASTGASVRAVVSDSAAYTTWTPVDTPAIELIQNLKAPVLILHGTTDETAPVQEARDYEAALKRLNKPYEAHYYEGSQHVVTRFGMATYNDAMSRAIAFLKKYLSAQRP